MDKGGDGKDDAVGLAKLGVVVRDENAAEPWGRTGTNRVGSLRRQYSRPATPRSPERT